MCNTQNDTIQEIKEIQKNAKCNQHSLDILSYSKKKWNDIWQYYQYKSLINMF